MWRFVLVSFVFLGLAFYEISGGDEYRPAPGSLQAHVQSDAAEQEVIPAADAERVMVAAARAEPGAQRYAVRPSEAVLRHGPGVGYGRMARLERHDEVDLLQSAGGGWFRVRVVETGRTGWIPSALLYRVP